jgi:hypothetical protein
MRSAVFIKFLPAKAAQCRIKDLVACDFFTVPTATFRVLFVFIMLAHERRRIVHFNITEHPTADNSMIFKGL